VTPPPGRGQGMVMDEPIIPSAQRQGADPEFLGRVDSLLRALRSSGDLLGPTGVGIALVSADGTVQWTNSLLRGMLPRPNAAGEACREAICAGSCVACPIDEAARVGQVYRTARTLTDAAGNSRSFHLTCVPLREGDGNAVAVAVFFLEFTAQETLARRARSQEQYILHIANAAAEAIIIVNPHGKIWFWNRGASQIFGYREDEVLGRPYEILVPEDRRQAGELDELWRRISEAGYVRDYETVRQAKDGRLVPVEITVTMVRDAEGREEGRSVIYKDITEKKRANLRQQLQQSRIAVLNQIGDAVHSAVDLEDVLIMILVGVTAEQGLRFNRAFLLLVDEDTSSLRGEVAIGPPNPEEAARIWGELGRLNLDLRGILGRFRGGAREENAEVNEIVRRIEVPLDRWDHVLIRALHERRGLRVGPGEPDGEVPPDLAAALGVDSLAVAPLLAREKAVGVLAADNAITHQAITDEDIDLLRQFAHHAGTAIENSRLYAELQQKIEELRRAHANLRSNQRKLLELEKLSAVGEMAAKVAHEIRTPLVSIGGFANQVSRRLGEDDPNGQDLKIIREEVLRLERIVGELLDFVRPPSRDFSPQDVNDLVEKSAVLMEHDVRRRNVGIRTHLGKSLPLVMVDRNQMIQVLNNLIQNAAQAMPEGGEVELTTEASGGRVRVHVDDAGVGIPEEHRGKLFRPFFSTKEAGSGLGLAIASQIVEQHQGTLEFQPREGRGTRFTVILPAWPEAGGSRDEEDPGR
jgi:PAS domain S-box-containing protein